MFTGSLVALVTPMDDKGDLDLPALDALVEWHIASGTHGIVPVGTTGESATVDFGEHLRLIERVVATVAGRVPVVAGVGGNATREALELTRGALAAGADGGLSVTPYYNRPTQEGLYRHYMTIADSVELPLLLYNVPPRTACDLLPETVERLAPHPRIVGIKEASGEVGRISRLRASCGADFVLLSGEDAANLRIMAAGGDGAVSVTANVAPDLMARCMEAWRSGDTATAETIDETLQPVHAALFCESSPAPTKWVLGEMGRIGPGIRLPLVPLSEAKRPQVRAAMEAAGLLPAAAH